MSAGMQTPDGLNVELNLVPFIDLLSSLVLFLLLSAVWIQISSISASVDAQSKVVDSKGPDNRLIVKVTTKGFELDWRSEKSFQAPRSLARTGGALAFENLAKNVVTAAKNAGVTFATVGGDDSVPYGEVIETLDAIKGAGMTSVAIKVN